MPTSRRSFLAVAAGGDFGFEQRQQFERLIALFAGRARRQPRGVIVQARQFGQRHRWQAGGDGHGVSNGVRLVRRVAARMPEP